MNKKQTIKKDMNTLKKLIEGFTKQQGLQLTKKQYKLIFGLAESLGIKDIGGLTLFYSLSIMPLLMTWKKERTYQNCDGTIVKDYTDSDDWYDAMNERNMFGLNSFVKIKELIKAKYNVDISKESDNIETIVIDEFGKFVSKISEEQLKLIRKYIVKEDYGDMLEKEGVY